MEKAGRGAKTTKLKIALLGGLLLLAGWLFFETYALEVERVDILIPGLPEGFDGYRIVQVSDLHGRRFSPRGKLAREAAAAQPDLIALTGDYVHNNAEAIANVLPLIRHLTQLAPTYGVSGNHDYWTDWRYIAEALDGAGVILLENAQATVSKNGDRLTVAGVNDPYTGHDDLAAAMAGAEETVILLAHSPTWFEPLYIERFGETAAFRQQRKLLRRADLTLVGHTHGGQIKLPIIGAVTTASGRLFPKTYVEGLSQEETGWLYISRGAGQGGLISFRFLSRPELTVITLRKTL